MPLYDSRRANVIPLRPIPPTTTDETMANILSGAADFIDAVADLLASDAKRAREKTISLDELARHLTTGERFVRSGANHLRSLK